MSLLDAKDVADMLGMSETWVRQHTRAEEIPHIRLGGRIKYRPEDIQRYVNDRVHGDHFHHGLAEE